MGGKASQRFNGQTGQNYTKECQKSIEENLVDQKFGR